MVPFAAMRVWFGCSMVLCATLCASAGLAQGSDATARAAARKLGNAGIDAYQASDFKGAADKLDKAYKVLQAPSLGLWSARAFVKNGRLVEASERYLEVTRLDISSGDKGVQQQSKLDAQKELDELGPRIPSLVVKLEGATPDQVALTIDGLAVKSALFGEATPIDPGAHKVEGVRGNEKVASDVTLVEGKEETVLLRFDPNASVPAAPVATTSGTAPGANQASSGATSTPPDAPAQAPAQGTSSPLPVLGWIGIAVGGAGIVAGGITGAMAIEKKADLTASGECEGGCKQTGRYENFTTLKTVSTVCFIAGGVLAVTGIVLVVVAPSKTTTVSLRVAPGEATVGGSF